MPNELPNITLKTASLQPVELKFAQYVPQTPDVNIMFRSMQTQEARSQSARKELNAITDSLNKIRTKLNPTELEAFDQYSADLQNDIRTAAELGNTESAIRFATDAADAIANNTTLANKMRVEEKHSKWADSIDSRGDIDGMTKEWAKFVNPYYYDGTANWQANTPIYSSLNAETFARVVANDTPVDSQTTSSSRTGDSHLYIDKDGNQITPSISNIKDVAANVYSSSSTRSSSNSYNQKTIKSLMATKDALLNVPDIRNSLEQSFKVSSYAYTTRKAKLDELKAANQTDTQEYKALLDECVKYEKLITNDNGILIDNFDDYVKYKVDPVIKRFAYRNTNTSTTISNTGGWGSNSFSNSNNKNYTDVPEANGNGSISGKGYPTKTTEDSTPLSNEELIGNANNVLNQ